MVAFESSHDQRRNLVWAVRAAYISALSRLDPELARTVYSLAEGVSGGSVRVSVSGSRRRKIKDPPPSFRCVSSAPLPSTYEEMETEPAAFVLAYDETVSELSKYVSRFPAYERRQEPMTGGPDEAGYWRVPHLGTPDLVVLAEGASCVQRRRLHGWRWASPPARQLAAVVNLPSVGAMVKGECDVDGSLVRAGAIYDGKRSRYWLVTDRVGYGDSDDATYLAHVAGHLCGSHVARHQVGGAGRGRSTPGRFTLRQRIVSSAAPYGNCILFGDAVGNGHWLEGGGIQVATVLHQKYLDEFSLSGGTPHDLQSYSERCVAATRGWVSNGLQFFDAGAAIPYRRALDSADPREGV